MPDPELKALGDWQRLRSGAPAMTDLEIPTIPVQVETGFGKPRIALGAGEEARLLIPISETSPVPDLPDLRSIEAKVRRLVGSTGSGRFIDLVCLDNQLESVFAELAGNVVQRISEGNSGREACEDAIQDFRTLLDAVKSETRESSEVRGLVGELLLLERLSTLSPKATELWRGPFGDRHDFRGGQIAMEAKASARISNTVSISSFEQMLIPDSGKLYLFNVVLETSVGGRLSVSELCNRIVGKTGDRDRLESALGQLGCDGFSDPAWNAHEFNIEGERAFRVEDGFPRLAPTDFEGGFPVAGVASITYDIDLSHARDFQLEPSQFSEAEQRIVECL